MNSRIYRKGQTAAVVIHYFDLLDHDCLHLNPASHLPPVECPLLIELEPGELVPAHRQRFVKNRGDNPEYHLADGRVIEGQYRWTYP